MYEKIAAMLDDIADSLEKKGLIKEAYEVDKIADLIEAAIPHGILTALGKGLIPAADKIKMMSMKDPVGPAVEIAMEYLGKVLGKGLSQEAYDEYSEAIKRSRSIPDLLKILYNIIMAPGFSEKKIREE